MLERWEDMYAGARLRERASLLAATYRSVRGFIRLGVVFLAL